MDYLKEKPFFLNDEDMNWVKETLAQMSIEEKIGQLFCVHGIGTEEEYLTNILREFKPGGFMFRPANAEVIRNTHEFLQKNSPVPLLLAANLEQGGNGISIDGTSLASPMQISATGKKELAYSLGEIAAKEGSAVGCNWTFAPVVDLDLNFRNPITNIRTFGSIPTVVRKMAKAYVEAVQKNGLASTVKHFPGDGVDERDQHLLTSVNDMTVEEWDTTFGNVFTELIEAGTKTIMAGHIALPQYVQHLGKNQQEEQFKPATLSKVLLKSLLREQLNFNGLIVSDSTMMAGFTMAMEREKAVPLCIESGCDMFLFNRDIEEDFHFMRKGVEHGLLSMERLEEAVARVLALKASLHLHRENVIPSRESLELLRCKAHLDKAKDIADHSITLVKDIHSYLPIEPAAFKKILLVPIEEKTFSLKQEGFYSQTHFKKLSDKLLEHGFKVTWFNGKEQAMRAFMGSSKSMKDDYDLVIYIANLPSANLKPTLRLQWEAPYASNLPWFIADVPTIFISLGNPYHLIDIPRVPVYINCYHSNEETIEVLSHKLIGASQFIGESPVDPFCGKQDTRL
ncbi:MAG: glycoside hydrolase family 3 protein [Bacillota bacterium]